MKDPDRHFWNEQQKLLRPALLGAVEHKKAIDLVLSQHAMVHAAEMSQSGLLSFTDRLWQDMTEQLARRIPQNRKHSVVWHIWHLARIEDVTMNMLVADGPQLLYRDDWLERLKVTARDTGNGMTNQGIADLSAMIDIDALCAYRLAVGRQTREIVQQLEPDMLKQKTNPARLQRVRDKGAVLEEGILVYWSRRTIAGLLLMPPTRHNFVHLNKAQLLRDKRR